MVVLAGCSGFGMAGDAGEPVPKGGGAAPTPASNDAGETTKPTAVAENPVAENPWRQEWVTVALNVSDAVKNESRHRQALDESVAWANENDVAAYPVTLRTGEKAEADVIVTVTPTIDSCHGEAANVTYPFCGPVFPAGSEANATEQIEITSRYEQAETRVYYHAAIARLVGVQDPTQFERVEFTEQPRLNDPFPTQSPVPVAIENPPDHINATRQVQSAVEYWESGAGASHRTFSVDFEVRPDAEDAPITVRYVDNLTLCGRNVSVTGYGGCAPRLSGDSPAPESVEIQVSTLYTEEHMEQVVTHEFGHIHGRSHDQQPQPLMSTDANLTMTQQPNATEREQPWRNETVSVYVDRDSVRRYDIQTFDDEMDGALEYVQTGADLSIPPEATIERTDNRSDANIVIEQGGLSEDKPVAVQVRGISIDTDDSLEYYTFMKIELNEETPTEEYAYYTAYWITRTFVGEDGLLPKPIDGENDDRKDWERHN